MRFAYVSSIRNERSVVPRNGARRNCFDYLRASSSNGLSMVILYPSKLTIVRSGWRAFGHMLSTRWRLIMIGRIVSASSPLKTI